MTSVTTKHQSHEPKMPTGGLGGARMSFTHVNHCVTFAIRYDTIRYDRRVQHGLEYLENS